MAATILATRAAVHVDGYPILSGRLGAYSADEAEAAYHKSVGC